MKNHSIPFRSLITGLAVLGASWLTGHTHAATCLYNFGTAKSGVWPGFTKVVHTNAYSAQTGFGWQKTEGLKSQAHAYTNAVHSASHGADEPPPIWTNPITEGSVYGRSPATFLVNVPAGDYEIYVVAGTSDSASSQYFDFTVAAGGQEQRVQLEGGYQFRALRFKARATGQPLAITFTPRTVWSLNAIMVWSPDAAQQVEKDILKPFEQWTWKLPPAEWAAWKQEPEPDPGPQLPLSAEEQQRGFRLFTRHYLECVYPHTNPRAEDLNPELRAFATLGEFEPLNFIVRPAKPLAHARVVVSDIGPVPAANIEVRRVRYFLARPNYRVLHRCRIVPDTLERFTEADLPADENTRFWLTLRVPENAKAGLYQGQVTFECDGAKAVVPVTLRILPIKLQDDPTKLFGIYYRHPLDRAESAPDDISREYFTRQAELEHADMVAHGTRNVVLHVSSGAADDAGNFKFKWDLLEKKLALWKKYGFRGPIAMEISTSSIYRKYVKGSFGSHLREIKDPPEGFSRELTALCQAIEQERVKRGWPEFLYYPIDEPGTSAEAVQFMVKVLKACKAANVRTYVTADPTHEQFAPLRPYIDVWCTQPFAPDRETVLADMKARKVEYWCYPNHINGENDHTPVAGARMTYGFGFWRSGFVTLIPWIYSSTSGDPFNYLSGASMDFFNRHEPDGAPMPVAMWEAYREGYDDYRYLYTLEQLIAKAGKKSAAAHAEQTRQAIWDAIRVQLKYKDKDLWSPEEFDIRRWQIAQEILELQKTLGL